MQLDGLLARRLNQVSPLGSFLDPFADKFFSIVVLSTLFHLGLLSGEIPFPIRLLVRLGAVFYSSVSRDCFLFVRTMWLRKRINLLLNNEHTYRMVLEPSHISKVNHISYVTRRIHSCNQHWWSVLFWNKPAYYPVWPPSLTHSRKPSFKWLYL